MNPNQSSNNDLQNVQNPLGVMQPGERVICELKRHPIGIISVYVAALIICAGAVAAAVLAPYVLTDVSQQTKLGVVLAAVLVVAVTLLYAYVAGMIYGANRWIVTSDSITQIAQTGLFGKETSQLSLANLEDVTVDQNGIIQAMFNFGTLRAESAGQRGKFFFSYCPDPNGYARKVIEAHEAYIAEHPEGTVAANRPLAAVQSFNQPSSNNNDQVSG